MGLKLELEEALALKVDLGEYETVKEGLRKYILEEEVQIMGGF